VSSRWDRGEQGSLFLGGQYSVRRCWSRPGDLRARDEELVVIVEGGRTEEDEPFRVRLDFEHPEQSQIGLSLVSRYSNDLGSLIR